MSGMAAIAAALTLAVEPATENPPAFQGTAPILTNANQFAEYFQKPGLSYPQICLWEPAHFIPPAEPWFADFEQLPKELGAVRDLAGAESHGIRVWPVRLIQYAATGEIAAQYPWWAVDLLTVKGEPDFTAFDLNLRLWGNALGCVGHVVREDDGRRTRAV